MPSDLFAGYVPPATSGAQANDLFAPAGGDQTPASAKPGLLSKVGGVAAGVAEAAVPALPEVIQAAKSPLTPSQNRVLNAGAQVAAPLATNPLGYGKGPTDETRREYAAESRAGAFTPEGSRVEVEPFTNRKQRIHDAVAASPVGRMVVAGVTAAPISFVEYGLAGLAERAVAGGIMHGAAMEAEAAVRNPVVDEVEGVTRSLARRGEIARRAAVAAAPVVAGEAELGREKLQDESDIPLSAYLETAGAGLAFGAVLGHVIPSAGRQAVNDVLVRTPYLRDQVKAAAAFTRGNPQLGRSTMALLQNAASDADRLEVQGALAKNPQVASSDFGKLLKDRARAATKFEVDERASPKDSAIVRFETPMGESLRAVNSKAEIRQLKADVAAGRGRIVSATGPRAKMSLLQAGAEREGPRPALRLADLQSQLADRISRRVAPKVQDQLLLDYRPAPVETPGYARRRFEVEGRQPIQTGPMAPGPIVTPAAEHAKQADAIVEAAKAEGFSPIQSGVASDSHAHPWMDTKAEGQGEVPTVVPVTGESMTVTPSTATEPATAALPPDTREAEEAYRSHHTKLGEAAQVESLATRNPTPIPAEKAFPASRSFVEKLHDSVGNGDLDNWIRTRTKAGKGESGKDWWATALGQVLKMSPDDPRITPEAARAAMNVMNEQLIDLEKGAKAGRLSATDPNAVRLLKHFDRFVSTHLDATTEELASRIGDLKTIAPLLDTDSTILKVHDQGDGTATVTRGDLSGTAVRVRLTGSLADEAEQLDKPHRVNRFIGESERMRKEAEGYREETRKLQRDIDKLSPDDLKHLQTLVDGEAIAAETTAREVAAPTETATPPPHVVDAPMDEEPKPLPSKGLKGFSKGAVRTTEWQTLDPNTSDIAGFAKRSGFGRVDQHPNGRVRVEATFDGKKTMLRYRDKYAAAAGIADIVNKKAEVARFNAELERTITTNTLPPLAKPSGAADPLIAMTQTIGSPSMGSDQRLTVAEKWAHRDETGILHDAEAWLGGSGKWGKALNFHLFQYRDTFNRLGAETDAELMKFRRLTGGKATVRGTESGTDAQAAAAWDQTGARLGDTRYKQGGELNVPLAPRVSGRWVPHWHNLTEVLSHSNHKVLRSFVNELVEGGLGADHNSAWQAFIGLQNAISHEDELALAEQQINSNRAGHGQAPLSRTEISNQLQRWRSRAESVAPNLQFDRTGSTAYSDNIYASARHAFGRMNRLIADRMVFGQKLERLNSLIDHIREEHGQDAANRALTLTNAMRGRNWMGYGVQNQLMNGLLRADRTYLSLSWLYHLPQNFFTAQRFGWANFTKGFVKTLNDLRTPEGREAAVRFGGWLDQTRERYYEGAVDPLIDRKPTPLEKLGDIASMPLEYAVNFSRQVATHVGRQVFDDLLPKVVNGDAKALKAMNELMGTSTHAANYAALGGKALDEARMRAGVRAADWAFFRFDALSAPPALAETPYLKMFMQFKNFLYPYTRTVVHELAGDGVPWQRRARMVATLGLLMPTYSYAHARLREALGAGTKNTHSMVKAFDKLYKGDVTFANAVNVEAQAFAVQHVVGLFEGVADAMWTGNSQNLIDIAGDIPSVSWLSTGVMAGRNGAAGTYNWAVGKQALANYQLHKAAAQGGTVLFGSLGRGLVTKALGTARKPTASRRVLFGGL